MTAQFNTGMGFAVQTPPQSNRNEQWMQSGEAFNHEPLPSLIHYLTGHLCAIPVSEAV